MWTHSTKTDSNVHRTLHLRSLCASGQYYKSSLLRLSIQSFVIFRFDIFEMKYTDFLKRTYYPSEAAFDLYLCDTSLHGELYPVKKRQRNTELWIHINVNFCSVLIVRRNSLFNKCKNLCRFIKVPLDHFIFLSLFNP